MKISTTKVVSPIAELIFAHGAGAGKDSEFMQSVAQLMAAHGIRVSLFDFPYMEKAQREGKRQPPNRMPVLQQDYGHVIEQLRTELPLFIGGKSMGGRVASLIASQSSVRGLICFGYPFHPPGKPEKTRTEHLYDLAVPTLIVQGERDTFGTRSDVGSYQLPKQIEMHFLASADHSFKPLKSSGLTISQHMAEATEAAANFIRDNL